jgi:hypothetical protein
MNTDVGDVNLLLNAITALVIAAVTYITWRLDRRQRAGESGEGEGGLGRDRATMGHGARRGPLFIKNCQLINPRLVVVEVEDSEGFQEVFHVATRRDSIVVYTTWPTADNPEGT